ncbi:high mobility group B protein 15-like [Tasmannia lanceolata]|uniref:high mobility group B protein 15-like n=1 Tax=Tasmannia lanceolata TaxID=3420 RepID=UPI00406379B7
MSDLLQKEKASDNGIYPSPLATYEQVSANPEIFNETLENLHKSIGTKSMIPTIGGKALDLHRLFVEVTSRGGLEKVIRDRKWREVIAVFNFPSTITNASFVLRKYYLSLLNHYEQVYFLRSQGRPVLMTASLPPENAINASAAAQVQVAAPPIRDNDATENKLTVNHPSPVGCLVTGIIDGKFDHGYLVTVNFGSDMLKGVLYHIPVEIPVPPVARISTPVVAPVVARSRSRKRSRRSLKDPFRPKSNRSGYNFFFSEHYARLKPLHCGEENTISKKIGHLWSNLTEAEREVYQQKGVKDKERYRSEMLEYRKSSPASKPH